MRIKVEKIVYPGKALGRGEDGIAVFTDNALPGEEVEVTVLKSKKSFREARTTAIITASPKRIISQCPSFGNCGGCSLQQTSYEEQLAIKESYIQQLLSRFEAPTSPIIRSPGEWGYRNKMEFSFYRAPEGPTAGLHQKGEFDRYFAVPPCGIADPDFLPVTEKVVAFARQSGQEVYDKRTHQGFYRHLVLRKGKKTGQLLVNLVTGRIPGIDASFFAPLIEELKSSVTSLYWTVNASISDAVKADELHLLCGKELIEEKLEVRDRCFSFNISPFSFFQTNTLATEILYRTAIDLLAPEADDVVLDLYCGTGTIGITVSPFVKEVVGVEQVEAAVKDAEVNKQKNGRENVSFIAGSVEKWIKHAEKPPFNALILDPPRGGLSNKVIDFIGKTLPARIVYVSCNPATLARDLAEIIARAGYRIERIVPVDMFPQTYHVETVVRLTKTAS
jgi:23S rRNA (uracil-5-)-methyltransferase RumA